MFVRFIAGLAGLLAMGSASLASAQALPKDTIDAAKVLSHLSSEAIDATMKTVTANHLAQVAADGTNYVQAYTATGLQFSIHFLQCEEAEKQAQCGALQLVTSWQVEDGVTGVDQLVAEAAPNHLFVNLGRAEDGRPYMSRIVIAGEGIAQGNLASEIEFFLQSAEAFGAQLQSLNAG